MRGKKTNILIANKEDTIRHLLRKVLGGKFNIIEARNGIESVEVARIHHPDIIFMDMFMPAIDSHTSCAELQSDVITEGIPLVTIGCGSGRLEDKLVLAMGPKDI